MSATRERKRDPHHCVECGADFEVAYYDDRTDERTALPQVTAQAPCPGCGKPATVSLPAGAERTLLVERAEGDADEGGGG